MLASSPDRVRRRVYWIGSLLFLVSGATGLAYEVIWFKRFAHVWGNSTLATATVVASFLTGLGIGAAWLGRVADRVASPLRWYGLLEAGIGVLALLVPLATQTMVVRIAPLVAPLHDVPVLHALVRFGLTFAVLGAPCILMGGTLPMLVRQFGGTAWLYAVNALGAALGCYLTGFHLLPTFGLVDTNTGAAILNLTIAAIAIVASRFARPSTAPEQAATVAGAAGNDRDVYAAAALTGAGVLVLQIVWSRQLAVILGASTYAFTAMLVVILVGIGVGSIVLHPWLRDDRVPRQSAAAVIVVLMAAVVLGQAGRDMLVDLVAMVVKLRAAQTANAFVSVVASGVLELLPSLGMGILFPLLVAVAARGVGRTGTAVGAVYAWNTVGTIAGAVVTPLVLLPAVGTARSVTVALVLYGVALLVLVLPSRGGGLVRLLLPVAAAASLLLSTRAWNEDPRHAHVGSYLYGYYGREQLDPLEPVFFAEGPSASVLVVKHPDGNLALHVNGKVDASSVPDMPMQLGLAYLPRFLRPAARSTLVIGLGSGTTAGASLLFPSTDVTAVEIEPAIVDATRVFAAVNHRPQESPHFRLVVDDGRSFLQGTPETYDLILSEPANPWIAGTSNLFTREFYDVVRTHLRPDGVLAQWIQVYGMDPDDYALILRTVRDVFPHVGLVHISASDTVLLASTSPLDGDAATIRAAQAIVDATPDIRDDLQRWFGSTDVLSVLLTHFILPDSGVHRMASTIGGEGVNTDVNMRLEFDAPRNVFGADRMADLTRALFTSAESGWFTGAFQSWGGTPAQADVFHTLGVTLARGGAAPVARTLSAYGHRLSPDNVQLLGDYYASGRLENAEVDQLADQLVTQAPARAAQLADALVHAKAADRALPLLERLTARHPHSAPQWQDLAVAYRTLKRDDDAARATATAADLAPFADAAKDGDGTGAR